MLEITYADMEMPPPLEVNNPGELQQFDAPDGSTGHGGVHTTDFAGVSNVAMHGNDRYNEHVTNIPLSQVPDSLTNDDSAVTDARPSSDVHAYVENTPSLLETLYLNEGDMSLNSLHMHGAANKNGLSEMPDEKRDGFDELWEYLDPVLSPFGKVIGGASAQSLDPDSETPFLEEHVGEIAEESVHVAVPSSDTLHDSPIIDLHQNPGSHPALKEYVESDWPDGEVDIMDSDNHLPGEDGTVMMDDSREKHTGQSRLEGADDLTTVVEEVRGRDGATNHEGMHMGLGVASSAVDLQQELRDSGDVESAGDRATTTGERVNERGADDIVDTVNGKNGARKRDGIVGGPDEEEEDPDEYDEDDEEYEDGDDETDEEEEEVVDETIDIPGDTAFKDTKGEDAEQDNRIVEDELKTESLDDKAKDVTSDNVQEKKDLAEDGGTKAVSPEATEGRDAGMSDDVAGGDRANVPSDGNGAQDQSSEPVAAAGDNTEEIVTASETGDRDKKVVEAGDKEATEESKPEAAATEDIRGSTTVGVDEVTTINGADSRKTLVTEGTTLFEDNAEQSSGTVAMDTILESSQMASTASSIEATPTPELSGSSVSLDDTIVPAAISSPSMESTSVSLASSASASIALEEPMEGKKEEERKIEEEMKVEVTDKPLDGELVDSNNDSTPNDASSDSDIQPSPSPDTSASSTADPATGVPQNETEASAVEPPLIPDEKLDTYVTPDFQTRRPLESSNGGETVSDSSLPEDQTKETTTEKISPDTVTQVPSLSDDEVAPPVGDIGATTEPSIQVAEEHDVDSTTQEESPGWMLMSVFVSILAALEPLLQALVNVVSAFIVGSSVVRKCHYNE